ncbi:hypothetical protein [Belliella pelovolcani]|uniref:hypothetical protein n=1 Tax=Belliella pelovolcani TaxID=529505 RepID=UPI0039197220
MVDQTNEIHLDLSGFENLTGLTLDHRVKKFKPYGPTQIPSLPRLLIHFYEFLHAQADKKTEIQNLLIPFFINLDTLYHL